MKLGPNPPRGCLVMCLVTGILLAACAPATAPLEAAGTSLPPGQLSPPPATSSDPFEEARLRMVRDQIEARGVIDPLVLEAMRRVPRHRFVDDFYLDQAYDDHPLPIGYGQTISQPQIVALMTETLGLDPGDRVLEIGTGSGYQAAILAEMGLEVYTVEIVTELAQASGELLADLGYGNISSLNADGYIGWEEFAPYQGILVTAAPDHLPQPLVSQLAEGGRLVIPIGPPGAVQSLWLFEKIEGEIQATNLGPVRFVPFTRGPESDPG